MPVKPTMKAIIEGLLYVAGDEGILLAQLEQILETDQSTIRQTIEEMKVSYENQDCGITIIDRPEGYQLVTKPSLASYIKKYVQTPVSASLSQAALETIAIIAYRMPISRIDIEDIRGVKSEKALQTLVSRGLIKEVGRAEGTGRAILYGVTNQFFTYFGLQSLEDLPPLSQQDFEESEGEESDLFYDQFKRTVMDL
ncbi:SMC-Scp complex subunit ScpB [Terrilactibacillus sp. BCM23-1]|uniref:Segregation and condensation protein B n=1 Tax=Terrilactibacillus tamarindi TaxID=2599694 RepID=A0A6N8CQL4_9BACI|nr:SMC-Scp complex subunit ScpB [Terrilactibacillus tamarindi]MTT31235.1 SMC-Scp complex subunit ScpB [Terrilactibacillus tamarindi]